MRCALFRLTIRPSVREAIETSRSYGFNALVTIHPVLHYGTPPTGKGVVLGAFVPAYYLLSLTCQAQLVIVNHINREPWAILP